MRAGKRTRRYRKWTKLTVVCHNASHMIVSAVVSIGPNNDCPHLPEAIRQAVVHLPIYRLLADAGYDAEFNHQLCREKLAIRSTVIPVNDRRASLEPSTRYRRQMKRRFPKRKYRQRWQVGSVVSRLKRRLGCALRARRNETRATECLVRVLTYNPMILHLLAKKVSTEQIQGSIVGRPESLPVSIPPGFGPKCETGAYLTVLYRTL